MKYIRACLLRYFSSQLQLALLDLEKNNIKLNVFLICPSLENLPLFICEMSKLSSYSVT